MDSQAEIVLTIFLFLPLYSRILLLSGRILQFQLQGIPRIFLFFTKSQPDIINFILMKKVFIRRTTLGWGRPPPPLIYLVS